MDVPVLLLMVVGPFNKIVKNDKKYEKKTIQTCFHDLTSDSKRNMTPPLRSIVFLGIVRQESGDVYGTWDVCYIVLYPTSI